MTEREKQSDDAQVADDPDDTSELGPVVYRKPLDREGFARIYHFLTTDTEISDGAFRTYVLLHKFAQQKTVSWPGVKRLAQDRGKDEATISRHLAELERRGLITRQRRMGTSSLTFIEDVAAIYLD